MISGLIGLSEHLFEKLTASPAEPHLRALKELFINFNGFVTLSLEFLAYPYG